MIKVGVNTVKDISIGNKLVNKVYRGSSLLWERREAETIAYRDRVIADGGELIDMDYVDACFKVLKTHNLLGSLLYYTSPSLGIKKDATGYISKLYSLIDGTDMIQTTGAYQPLFQADTLNGKPNIYYDGDDAFNGVLLPKIPTVASVFQVAKETVGGDVHMLWAFGTTSSDTYDLYQYANELGLNNFDGNIYGINDAHLFLEKNFIIKSELHSMDYTKFYMQVNGVERTSSAVRGTTSNRPINQTFNLAKGYIHHYLWKGWIADTMVLDKVLTTAENDAINNHLNGNYLIY
jgi:hypothetical protein